LIILELSLSLVLLVTAMLTMQSFLRLTQSKLGFDSREIATASVALAGPHYDSLENRTAFFNHVLDQIAARPGMKSVAAVSYLPSRGGASARIETEDHPISDADAPVVMYNVVAGDFFGTMRIPILLGRGFTARDWEDTSSNVVVINQTMATQLWPHQSAIGSRVRLIAATKRPWLTVIGVVGDIAQDGLGAPKQGEIFRAGTPGYSMSFVARTERDMGSAMTAIRQSGSSVDPRVPVYDYVTQVQVIARSESVWIPRLYGIMFGAFASAALLLAIVGVSGVVAFEVRQRTKEIGLRVALGAAPIEVVRIMLVRITTLAIIGVTIGITASLAAGRVLRGLLFGISESDPATLIAVPLALLSAVLIASYFPARQAARVDPSLVLRED
jgi:predicted permease